MAELNINPKGAGRPDHSGREAHSVRLRAVEPGDAEFLWRAENDDADTSDYLAPLSRHQLEEYARGYNADPFGSGELRLVVEADGEAAGLADLFEISLRDLTAKVGIYVAPAWRGRGVGSEAVRLLTRYAFRRLGLEALCAMVGEKNAASLGLFRRLGWESVGFLPSWRRLGSRRLGCWLLIKLNQE